MSEATTHTPGPLRYQGETEFAVIGGDLPRRKFQVYTASGKFGHPAECEREADAVRLVELWNAAEGLTNEEAVNILREERAKKAAVLSAFGMTRESQ